MSVKLFSLRTSSVLVELIRPLLSSLNRKIPSYNVNMNESCLMSKCRELAPPLTRDKHKGSDGRIGVFGGSLEYTGAPFYAAITSLKVGADLVFVFCMKSAATVIKSYSPELIVLPYLDDSDAESKIEPWLERLHAVLIGPGLGRENKTFEVITKVINMCRKLEKPLIIDADGLFFVANNKDIIKDYPATIILTPNVVEFSRMVGPGEGKPSERAKDLLALCPNLTLLCKGSNDVIFNSEVEVKVVAGGSGRRSGGQGDLLSGALATFLTWALNKPKQTCSAGHDNRAVIAAFASCKLVRSCNEKAFTKYGRSMTALDMTHEIHSAFEENFERSS